MLLRSDGTVAGCGCNEFGQCDIPALIAGILAYTKVAAGRDHSLLLRSDGTAEACGGNQFGQCDIPALDAGLTYTKVVASMQILQASYDGGMLHFTWCSGNEACKIEAVATDTLVSKRRKLASYLDVPCHTVDVVFPGSQLLSTLLRENSEAKVSAVFKL